MARCSIRSELFSKKTSNDSDYYHSHKLELTDMKMKVSSGSMLSECERIPLTDRISCTSFASEEYSMFRLKQRVSIWAISAMLLLNTLQFVYFYDNGKSSLRCNKSSVMAFTWNKPNSINHKDLHPKVAFGHLHLAKTAGTEIDGELASHFDGVCGNKGYSYDFFQFNERVRNSTDRSARGPPGDIVSQLHYHQSRGKVPFDVMEEIGFENCDWISAEIEAEEWQRITRSMGQLELHVPCREPISHLLSQCNFKQNHFDCNAQNLEAEVKKHLIQMRRFSSSVFNANHNLTLKCFNPLPIEPYLYFMSDRLLRKRTESDYVHRDTNVPRQKDKECLLKNSTLANLVRDILVQEIDLYEFCHACMGSADELILPRHGS